MIGESELHQFTSDTWATVLGLDLEPTGRAFQPSTDTVTGCVQVSGGWRGAVVLVCPVPLAKRVAAVMFDLPPDGADAEFQSDAIGELVNILGGNVKAMLPGPSHLSLPAVAHGTQYAVRIPGGECVAEGVFECEGQPFLIAVVEAQGSPTKLRAPEAECAAACI